MPAIQAVFENGVFRPTQPVSLPEGCAVTVEPTSSPAPTEEDPLERELRWLTSRTPEQVLRDRDEVLKTSRPARPLPPGKTLSEVVEGKWPGDETDEQIREALERLS